MAPSAYGIKTTNEMNDAVSTGRRLHPRAPEGPRLASMVLYGVAFIALMASAALVCTAVLELLNRIETPFDFIAFRKKT